MKNIKPNTHAFLSCSSAHRWMNCTASAEMSERYEKTTSVYAEEGSKAHELCARLINDNESFNPATAHFMKSCDIEMQRHAEDYASYCLEYINADDVVTYGVEQLLDLSSYIPEGFGTCDFYSLNSDTLTIIDFKYGVGKWISPHDNEQLKCYALGVLDLLASQNYPIESIKTINLTIFQPRLNNISQAYITPDDLMLWGRCELTVKANEAYKRVGVFKSGDWCQYCPHYPHCREIEKTVAGYLEAYLVKQSTKALKRLYQPKNKHIKEN